MEGEKLCVFCQEMYWNNSEAAWSEMTPGADFSCGCYTNADRSWYINGEHDTLEEFREAILSAKDCPDYNPVGGA